ncbi:MAG: hypothetical protein KDE58_30545, partial [Caldilineaceae bacterium]|nr:hypothetical protein [Caldilineaceae bacterium]
MSLQEAERRIAECRDTQNLELDLGNLELTAIPTSVFELSHLQVLLLGYFNRHPNRNRIETLPESITQLTNLQRLDLSYN